jgi:hypothetical protein
MTHNTRQVAAIFYSMAVLTACASQTPRDFSPRPQTGLSAISAEEVLSSTGTNAYELVERMRPLYLTTSVDLAPTAEREVYLNGVRLGGLSQLRGIPAREVKDIRFVRAIDGIVYGVGRSGGAILVTSKAGR